MLFYVILLYYFIKDQFMKKIIMPLFFIPIFALAELDIDKLNNVLLSIKSSHELKFYSSEVDEKIDKSLKFTSLNDADIILFPEEINNKKMMIVHSFKELKANKNSIGAIYLRKGRTQIIFVKERLENNGLVLPKFFNKYIISTCQLNPTCLLLNY